MEDQPINIYEGLSQRAQYLQNILQVTSKQIQQKTQLSFDDPSEFNQIKQSVFAINHIQPNLQLFFEEIRMPVMDQVIKRIVHSSYLINLHLLKVCEGRNRQNSKKKDSKNVMNQGKMVIVDSQPTEKQKKQSIIENRDSILDDIDHSQRTKVKGKIKKMGGVHLYRERYERKMQKQTVQKDRKQVISIEEERPVNYKQFRKKIFTKMAKQIKQAQQSIYNPIDDEVKSFIAFEKNFIESFNHNSRAEDLEKIVQFFNKSTLEAADFLKKNNLSEEVSKFANQLNILYLTLKKQKQDRQKGIQNKFQEMLAKFISKKDLFKKKILQKLRDLQQKQRKNEKLKMSVGTQTTNKQLKSIKIYESQIEQLQNKLTYFEVQKEKKFQQLLQKIDRGKNQLRCKDMQTNLSLLKKDEEIKIMKLEIQKLNLLIKQGKKQIKKSKKQKKDSMENMVSNQQPIIAKPSIFKRGSITIKSNSIDRQSTQSIFKNCDQPMQNQSQNYSQYCAPERNEQNLETSQEQQKSSQMEDNKRDNQDGKHDYLNIQQTKREQQVNEDDVLLQKILNENPRSNKSFKHLTAARQSKKRIQSNRSICPIQNFQIRNNKLFSHSQSVSIASKQQVCQKMQHCTQFNSNQQQSEQKMEEMNKLNEKKSDNSVIQSNQTIQMSEQGNQKQKKCNKRIFKQVSFVNLAIQSKNINLLIPPFKFKNIQSYFQLQTSKKQLQQPKNHQSIFVDPIQSPQIPSQSLLHSKIKSNEHSLPTNKKHELTLIKKNEGFSKYLSAHPLDRTKASSEHQALRKFIAKSKSSSKVQIFKLNFGNSKGPMDISNLPYSSNLKKMDQSDAYEMKDRSKSLVGIGERQHSKHFFNQKNINSLVRHGGKRQGQRQRRKLGNDLEDRQIGKITKKRMKKIFFPTSNTPILPSIQCKSYLI